MPQNENLSKEWRDSLGSEWKNIQEAWLHTSGNLTLTGYNAEYSDRSFREKREMPGGFKDSPLKLNQGLGSLTDWNEETIKERAERLSNIAASVWHYPKLDDNILDDYRTNGKEKTEYSIEDHPYLLSGLSQKLFEAFRKEVLSLDPVVTEEFLKLYVAYKAETNFVDVVPQSNRLRLSLNMRFPDIYDPKGKCKDVSGIGRWGNGDVEVMLTTLDDLPYIMGLVRQSFEQQMGNGGEV